MTYLKNYLKKIYTWILPFNCILCSRITSDRDLCKDCEFDLPILPQSCPQCAKMVSKNSSLCGQCLVDPPVFQFTHALFSYEPPITKLIMELKFHNQLINARLLGELLYERIPTWYQNQSLPEILIPVPLHQSRLKQRGFNQTVEISRLLQKKLGLNIDIKHCHRIKSTAAQARLPESKRRENMKNAFLINGNFGGKHLAILDDVITTGQTILEFSKALKAAGAGRIDVWACARTLIK